MKTIDDYMNMPYKMEIIQDPDERGFVASFPELPGCITCGSTMDELIGLIDDAKRVWFSDMLERGMTIPEPKKLEDYSNYYKLHLPKSLYKQLSDNSKAEGVSMNQYCVYLLSKSVAC